MGNVAFMANAHKKATPFFGVAYFGYFTKSLENRND